MIHFSKTTNYQYLLKNKRGVLTSPISTKETKFVIRNSQLRNANTSPRQRAAQPYTSSG